MSKKAVAILSFFIGGIVASIAFLCVLIWFTSNQQSTTFSIDTPWVQEVNKYRLQNNIGEVKEDYYLNTLAEAKCDDMITRDYFAHYDSNGNSVGDLSESLFDVKLKAWGENISQGTILSVSEAISYWYNSPSHRENLLNPSYQAVGHAKCFNGGSYNLVEVFSDGSETR